jgi:hypothetical protein
MAFWDSIPEADKPFQRRLMEGFAGFTEHADHNAGRVIDEIEREGKQDKGRLVSEYNMMVIEHHIARSSAPFAPGRHKIEVSTTRPCRSINSTGGPSGSMAIPWSSR